MEKEKKGFAAIIPFEKYPAFRAEWFAANKGIKVIEEMKTISQGQIDVPDPQLIGKTRPQLTIIVIWGLVYWENKPLAKV